jgi:trehalose 6-phosphate synthase
MNLVAKEFVSARDDERGVLILSQATGAALQLPEALLINPWAIDSSADAIIQALTMPDTEQTKRMRLLRSTVASSDVQWWTRLLLTDAAAVRGTDQMDAPIPSRAVRLSA